MGNNPGTEDYFYNTGQNTQDGKPVSNYNSGSVAPLDNKVYLDRIKKLAGYAEGGSLNSVDDDDIIKNDRSYKVRRNMFDKIVSVEKYTDEDGSKWKIKNKYNPDTKENIKKYWVDGKFSGRFTNQDEPEYMPVKERIEFNNQPSVTYGQGGPMVSNVPQPFNGPSAQNRGGMMVEYGRGGNMYAMGGPDGIPGFDLTGDEYNNFLNQVDDSELTMDPTFNALKNFNRNKFKNFQPIQSKPYTFPTDNTMPGITGNVEPMPGLSEDAINPYISPYQRYLLNNYPEGLNNLNYDNNDNYTGYITPPNANKKSATTDSTTPWYEEPGYSKLARYAPLAVSAAGVATGLMNKKRRLDPTMMDARKVNYERERIGDKEESRGRYNTFAKKMTNSAINAGMLAGNLKEGLLGSNKDLAGRISESVMREENTNAQLAQQADMTNTTSKNQFKQINESMFQNAQTQALRAAQEGAMALQSGAEQERDQYLQEWLAKNRLNTRSYKTNIDGRDVYVSPNGKIYDEQGNAFT
jgi:hypothetical protein